MKQTTVGRKWWCTAFQSHKILQMTQSDQSFDGTKNNVNRLNVSRDHHQKKSNGVWYWGLVKKKKEVCVVGKMIRFLQK